MAFTPRKHFHHCLLVILSLVIIITLIGCKPSKTTAPSQAVPHTIAPVEAPDADIPYDSISLERMLADLEVLTTIQQYSGFRTAGTIGEAEALDYVETQLGSMSTLKGMGMELERQSFNVFVTTEIRATGLFLTGVGGAEVEVPANGLRGSRYRLENALYFDTDGTLNDSQSDPMTASGSVLLIRDSGQLFSLTTKDVSGKILFLDEHLFDPFSNNEATANRSQAFIVIDMGAAGVVLVSEYNNRDGASHASMIGDGYFFQNSIPRTLVPILHARLSDLAPAGITTWKDLEGLTGSRMLLDSDVLSPAPSGNLIARIPGKDPSRAMIVSAHIDSPNGPGGFDDGSGSTIVLEIARVLDEAGLQPDVDLYLGWYGSHENGLYGSAWFTATHADVLDRALAQLQIDCAGLPMEGKTSDIVLNFNSYDRFGDGDARWQDYLAGKVGALNIPVKVYDEYGLIADNSNYDTYNVPEADLIYFNTDDLETYGNGYIHFSNHWHDAYETVDVVRQAGDVLVDMAKVALTAAIQTGRDKPGLRVTTPVEQRALFVASHTEPRSMPLSLRELGMGLAWEGFDVDTLPYGQPVTADTLKDAGIVVLLPTIDFPGDKDENWSQAELDALDQYVKDGGFLVVTNSEVAHIMTVPASDPNEDDLDINALLGSMGAVFNSSNYQDGLAFSVGEHALSRDALMLNTYGDAGVIFTQENGQSLYTSGRQTIVALLEYGDQGGQVLVIGDLGLMIDNGGDASNLAFIRNLAAFARAR